MRADLHRFDIVTAGELLAEFVAERPGQRFDVPGRFQGPFPSGAPAIFASQAARMGARVAYAGCVGSDGFGDLILDRLTADGIDTAAVGRDADYPTGTAFVRYRDDGDRDFIFNLTHSAAARLDVDDAGLERLADCRYLHVMGSSLSSPATIALIDRLATRVRARGGRISFDPNIRAELMADPATRAAVLTRIDDCDVFLPSEADLAWLSHGEPEAETVARLLDERRMSLVVLKRAARGSEAFTSDHAPRRVAAYPVDERDPTGAGDCFGGALMAALAAGESLERALQLASAAGAHAVTRVGPMEGCSDRATLDALIASHGGAR
ncbi:sugar kinase [Chromohalobacter sp. TMW 2.2308]|uniref:sugar kinase n=1 Tax=Chromohalobacter TaxID=42054 RepID=UPI001FFCB3BF|nr:MULTISPECIES: sugar kinase [Chromohalobacter]MCK2041220.1 sugar kinase [Chromohalobacter moromii]MCT8513368.1 sugar kinase [Chromohalobacter sp. TMW 2.2271]